MIGTLPLLVFADTPPLTASFSSTAPVQPAHTAQNPIPVNLTFSEGVVNLTAGDLTVGNGSVTGLASTSDSVYTFGIIPAASGSVSVDLNAGLVTGADGQTNQAAPQLQFIYDPSAADASTTNSTTTTTATSTPSSNASSTPAVTITSPANGATIASSTVIFDFTVTPSDATAACLFGDATTTYACGSPQTFFRLPSGTYPFTVVATSADGTASSSASVSITVNFTAPAVTEVTPVPTPTTNTSPSYTFSSTEAGTLTLGGGCSTSATSTDATTTTITFNTLASGTYDCTLTVTDSGGNVSNTLAITPFTVNAPAPASTPASSGGGGGGMIVGSGPLAPGYVNTNPQAGATPAPAAAAAQPAATTQPATPRPVTSSAGSGSSIALRASKPKVAIAVPAASTGTSSAVTISSSTPGLPNTGATAPNSQTAAAASSGASGWVVAGIVVLVIILLGGALYLSRGVS